MDLATQTSWFLVTGTGASGGPRGPCFSPDGSLVAFANTRYDKDKTPHFGVYTVPLLGGTITRVVEATGSKKTEGFPTVNNWNTP